MDLFAIFFRYQDYTFVFSLTGGTGREGKGKGRGRKWPSPPPPSKVKFRFERVFVLSFNYDCMYAWQGRKGRDWGN